MLLVLLLLMLSLTGGAWSSLNGRKNVLGWTLRIIPVNWLVTLTDNKDWPYLVPSVPAQLALDLLLFLSFQHELLQTFGYHEDGSDCRDENPTYVLCDILPINYGVLTVGALVTGDE